MTDSGSTTKPHEDKKKEKKQTLTHYSEFANTKNKKIFKTAERKKQITYK